VFLGVSFGQNAPAVNWTLVQPMQNLPSFFEDYPFLEELFVRFNPAPSLAGNEGQQAAAPNAYPYHVGLVLNRRDGLGFCSGALISNQWILTAAHCIDGITTGTAHLGASDIRNPNQVGQARFIVTQFFPHPGWNGLRFTDDVGLIQLPTPIVPSANISPVRLGNARQVSSSFVNQRAVIPGWGRMLFSPASPQPQVVTRFSYAQVSQALTCRLAFINLIESAQICSASSDWNGCPADGGGPLVITEADNVATLVGINSFVGGLGCDLSRPVIFNRVTFYQRWISQVTGIPIADNFVF